MRSAIRFTALVGTVVTLSVASGFEVTPGIVTPPSFERSAAQLEIVASLSEPEHIVPRTVQKFLDTGQSLYEDLRAHVYSENTAAHGIYRRATPRIADLVPANAEVDSSQNARRRRAISM